MRSFWRLITAVVLVYQSPVAVFAQNDVTPSKPNTSANSDSAAAKVIERIKAEDLAGIVRDAGYSAELRKGDKGNQWVRTRMEGLTVSLDLYGCNDDGCDEFQFNMWLDKAATNTLSRANDFNSNYRYGRSYLDQTDGTMNFGYDVLLRGGVTVAFIKANIDRYDRALSTFNK
jgi:hypothetical protein